MADVALLDQNERRSLALARLMASRAAWHAALAPADGHHEPGPPASLWVYLAQGRRWLRAIGAEPLFDELREQLQPWVRQRPIAALAVAALAGAGVVAMRPWSHAWLWRTLSQLPWAAWVAEAASLCPAPPPPP